MAELVAAPGDAPETHPVVDPETYKEIEQKQKLKRKKLDDRAPSFIVFDYFPDRESFHRKQNPSKRVVYTGDL